jgi:hypothetical protein
MLLACIFNFFCFKQVSRYLVFPNLLHSRSYLKAKLLLFFENIIKFFSETVYLLKRVRRMSLRSTKEENFIVLDCWKIHFIDEIYRSHSNIDLLWQLFGKYPGRKQLHDPPGKKDSRHWCLVTAQEPMI